MLTWPHVHGDWGPNLDAIDNLFVELARVITRYERLLVVCHDAAHRRHIQQRLAGMDQSHGERLYFARVASDDSWARDHGPITVLDKAEAVLLDFQFNGWGGKYPAELDNAITEGLLAHGTFNNRCHKLDTVLEGGSIEVDGEGTLLTTSRCLLTPTRNPRMERPDWERLFARYFGIHRTLWLDEGELFGDDTDGHIDMLARFCSPTTMAYTSCDRPGDPQYAPLRRMAEALAAMRRRDGHPYELVPLPIPEAQYDAQGMRLPASYANFLIINDAVLVPAYNAAEDDIACRRLEACFPGRDIQPVDCRAAIEQHGSLHCLTMQLPRGVNF